MKITKEDKSALSKRTFLLVELESETDPLKLEEKQLEILLKNNLKTLFGEIGGTGISLRILKLNTEKRFFIMDTEEKNLEKVRQTLFMATRLNENFNSQESLLSFKILNFTNSLANLDVNSQNDFY